MATGHRAGGNIITMTRDNSTVTEHLLVFQALTSAAAKVFTELPTSLEQSLLLHAMALADSGNYVSLENWSAISGIKTSTLRRFAKIFIASGLLRADMSDNDALWLEQSTLERMQVALKSGIVQ